MGRRSSCEMRRRREEGIKVASWHQGHTSTGEEGAVGEGVNFSSSRMRQKGRKVMMQWQQRHVIGG